MPEDNETFTAEIDRFDAKIMVDFMVVIFGTCMDPSVSDEDFRNLVKTKVESIAFLMESGAITQNEEQIEFVQSLMEEDNGD